jgi:hypothetical protein
MDKRYFLIFSFLFTNTLAFAQNCEEVKQYYKESKTLPHFRDDRFIKRYKLPTPKFLFGVRMGYDFNANIWSAGGQFWIPIGPVQFIPSGDIFFEEKNMGWQFNIDAALPIRMGFGRLLGRFQAGFYGGGGFAIINRDIKGVSMDGRKIGTNLFIGMRLPVRSIYIRPFVEARWTFVDGENPFHLIAGINIPLGLKRSRKLPP